MPGSAPSNSENASIFLSCGQAGEEAEIAAEIKEKLERLGFSKVWVAVQVRDYQGLLQDIYPALNDSDYFVFVDFKREFVVRDMSSLPDVSALASQPRRGSLFSHQELAIANFLKIPFLAFQESGLDREGILGAIMGNAAQFNDRTTLAADIYREVKAKLDAGEWNIKTKNRLELVKANDTDRLIRQDDRDLQQYHINVKNLHHRKRAANCCAYCEKILRNGEPLYYHSPELKWEGLVLHSINIQPGSERGFDAFLIGGTRPYTFMIPAHTDAGGQVAWRYETKESAIFDLSYVVSSDQFVDARATFRVVFNAENGRFTFEPLAAT